MAASDLVWIDGFDTYGTTSGNGNILSQRYSDAGSLTLPAGRFGGQCVRSSSGLTTMGAGITATTELSVGVAIHLTALPNPGSFYGLLYFQTGSSIQAMIAAGSDGSIVAGRQDVTTNAIATSAAGVFVANAWNFVEVELVIHDTTGSIKVWCNGVQVINATNVDTKGQTASTANTVRMFPNSSTTAYQYDDLYICDVAARLGECRVETIRPTADTADKDWLRSTGSDNYALVDDSPSSDGDATYISSSTVGDLDLYAMNDLTSAPATIHAVQTVLTARKDDAATREIRSKLKSGSTTGDGPSHALSGSYATYRDIFVTNPDTAAAWTGTEVNNANIGVEVVT